MFRIFISFFMHNSSRSSCHMNMNLVHQSHQPQPNPKYLDSCTFKLVSSMIIATRLSYMSRILLGNQGVLSTGTRYNITRIRQRNSSTHGTHFY